jgi:YggT family protein
MRYFFSFLAAAAGIYSLLIFIRIIISWFSGNVAGRPADLLSRITDPYLDWWRRNLNLRLGFLDLSPVVAIAFLSIVQRLLYSFTSIEKITVGNILAILLLSLWPIVSFIFGFCLIILILRFVAYLTNRDMYGTFWRIVESISQPLLYRTNRIIFGKRIPGYLQGLSVSFLVLAVIWILGKYLIPQIARLLEKLPI